MTIALKLVNQTVHYRYYELPKFVTYKNVVYNMNSPSNLIRALNKNKESLLTIFHFQEIIPKISDVCICRKQIKVKLDEAELEKNKLICENKRFQLKIENSQRKCAICDKSTTKSKFLIGTCSAACKAIKLAERNTSVVNNHWIHRTDANQIHKQRIKTRKQNDIDFQRKYIPWNKGHVGKISEITRQKISNAALKQFSEKRFQKTKIESIYEQILIDLKIEYIYSYIFHRRQFDFYLPSKNLIIEIQGDFWHGNPKIWGVVKQLREHQKIKRLDDQIKKNLVETYGLRYFEFWEDDIHHNVEEVIRQTKELIK